MKWIKYLFLGMAFGIILIKSEVVSWFRIQEMFRFQAFHMYGVIGLAVFVAMISVFMLKKLRAKSLDGETISIKNKTFHWGNVYGGLIFGVGWAITGACPGPIFAQIGSGYVAAIITFLSALFGTWFYGFIRNKLPH